MALKNANPTAASTGMTGGAAKGQLALRGHGGPGLGHVVRDDWLWCVCVCYRIVHATDVHGRCFRWVWLLRAALTCFMTLRMLVLSRGVGLRLERERCAER